MNLILLLVIALLSAIVDGQECRARFDQSFRGQCMTVDQCQGTAFVSQTCRKQICCVTTKLSSVSHQCLSAQNYDSLYNTPRATYLRNILSDGINAAGICNNCYAKAAFLAIAATMTDNFQTDEVNYNDHQLSIEDNMYGNKQVGDGSRFRRRGLFGLRGREMYERLQKIIPQYPVTDHPELAALTENAIKIAVELWHRPNLINEAPLTQYTDGSIHGFSTLWNALTGNTEQLLNATNYYSRFIKQLKCESIRNRNRVVFCQFNETHNGVCKPNCIEELLIPGLFCGCTGPIGPQCPNSPENVRCCVDTCSDEIKLDLGIVIDAGSSIGINNYRAQIQYVKELLRRVNVGHYKTHVAIINYSDVPQMLTWLNREYDLQSKLNKLDNLTYLTGGSNTAQALEQANIAFSNGYGRRTNEADIISILFVISDGISEDQGAAIRAAKVLKNQEITIVTVSVGNKPHLGELRAVCSPPKSVNNFHISDTNALTAKLDDVKSDSCSQPVVSLSNTTITFEISKDEYQFIKVQIVFMGQKILVSVTLFNGNVNLYYSFTDRNPKDNTHAKNSEKNTFKALPIRGDSINGGSKTFVIDKPSDDVSFVYIGLKGLGNDNKFEVKVDDCDKVYCKSNGIMMKFNLILIILSLVRLL